MNLKKHCSLFNGEKYFIYILMSLLILANYHSCIKRLIKLYQSLKRFCLWCSFYCKWYLFRKTALITTRRELYLFSSYCGSVKILRFLCLVLFLNLWNPFSLIHVKPDKVSSFSQSLPLSAIIAGTPPPQPGICYFCKRTIEACILIWKW